MTSFFIARVRLLLAASRAGVAEISSPVKPKGRSPVKLHDFSCRLQAGETACVKNWDHSHCSCLARADAAIMKGDRVEFHRGGLRTYSDVRKDFANRGKNHGIIPLNCHGSAQMQRASKPMLLAKTTPATATKSTLLHLHSHSNPLQVAVAIYTFLDTAEWQVCFCYCLVGSLNKPFS